MLRWHGGVRRIQKEQVEKETAQKEGEEGKQCKCLQLTLLGPSKVNWDP